MSISEPACHDPPPPPPAAWAAPKGQAHMGGWAGDWHALSACGLRHGAGA